jgi:hypothetical protein
MTPQKIFGTRVYAEQRESTGRMDMGRRPDMTTRGGGVGGNIPKALEKRRQGGFRKSAARSSTAHLDKLIEEATVHCYNESEEVTGIFTILEENLNCARDA